MVNKKEEADHLDLTLPDALNVVEMDTIIEAVNWEEAAYHL